MELTATEPRPTNPESGTFRLRIWRRAGRAASPSSRPHYFYPSKRRIMATSTLLTPSSDRSRFKTLLWISLGLTVLFVFITSEVLLVTDYPMYHAYRLQVIADRQLLIPHTLCGVIALLAGPVQFSSRFRQRHLKLHRVLGRIYVISVFIGALPGSPSPPAAPACQEPPCRPPPGSSAPPPLS